MSTEDYDKYGVRLDGLRQLLIWNSKHLRQVPSTKPRSDVVVMPLQPAATQHQVQVENRPEVKPSEEPETNLDLEIQEIRQSEVEKQDTCT